MKIFLLIVILLFFGCGGRKINESKTRVENYEARHQGDTLTKGALAVANGLDVKTEITELRNIISNLNIGYSGKNLDDKLDVLLKRTGDGTRFTISGVGVANFKENSQNEVKVLKKEIIKHYDSLHVEQIGEIKSLKTEIKQEITAKEKQSSYGGSVFWWSLLGIVAVFIALPGFEGKLFKQGLKSVLKMFK